MLSHRVILLKLSLVIILTLNFDINVNMFSDGSSQSIFNLILIQTGTAVFLTALPPPSMLLIAGRGVCITFVTFVTSPVPIKSSSFPGSRILKKPLTELNHSVQRPYFIVSSLPINSPRLIIFFSGSRYVGTYKGRYSVSLDFE